MLVIPIRSDLRSLYINDIENRSQRNFSSEPAGQSLYVNKGTNAEFSEALENYGYVALISSTNSNTFNTTSGNNTLVVKDSASGSSKTISVTSNAALTRAALVSDLNTGFSAQGVSLSARVYDTNRVVIESTGTNKGSVAYIEILSSSTLEDDLGLSTTPVTSVDLETLLDKVYPTSTSANVSESQMQTISQFAGLSDSKIEALTGAIQSVAGFNLVETGPVLLSFAYGTLSKLSSSSYQPGAQNGVSNVHVDLPVGPAVVCLENDGSTLFSL